MSIKYTINVKGANGSFTTDGIVAVEDPLESESIRHGNTGELLGVAYKVIDATRIKITESSSIIWQNNVDIWAGRNKSENPVLEITYQSRDQADAKKVKVKCDNSKQTILALPQESKEEMSFIPLDASI